jgi:hypothetical protein
MGPLAEDAAWSGGEGWLSGDAAVEVEGKGAIAAETELDEVDSGGGGDAAAAGAASVSNATGALAFFDLFSALVLSSLNSGRSWVSRC